MKEIICMCNLVDSARVVWRRNWPTESVSFILAITLFLPGTAFSSSKRYLDPFYAHPRHRPPGRGSEDMQCPKAISDDDLLIMNVKERRGDDFGVTRPGKDDLLWLGVSDIEFVNGSDIPPTGTTLKALGLGRVRVRDMVGWSGNYPMRRVRIFTRPGVYLFEIAETFETEDPIVNHWCNVLYRPTSRLRTRRLH